jgi:hypothetical protein
MFNFLRRRRLSAEAQRKLKIVKARAEEAVIGTHVDNVLELYDMLGEEVDIERALDLYLEDVAPGPLEETMAAAVANRVMATHLRPPGRRGGGDDQRYRNVFRDGR